MINHAHRIILTSLCILTGFVSYTYGAVSLHPVAPALAISCAPAMGYKVISEKYQETITVLERYWDVSSGKISTPSLCEQALEELFIEIKKTGLSGYDYMGMLELDLHALSRIAQLPEKLPIQASWLPGALKKLISTLHIIRTILTEHRSFSLLTDVHASTTGMFARELALLKSKQQVTLLEYMRTNRRDYAKELMFWKERLMSALVMAGNNYPKLSQSVDHVSKQLAALNQTYAKI